MRKMLVPQSTTERWLPIPGFEGRYEASDAGRVRSLERYCPSGLGGRNRRLLPACVLKQQHRQRAYRHHGDSRYCIVYLRQVGCGNAGGVPYFVHQLVLRAFVGPPPDGHETRHLDGNPGNNRLENLTWGTPTENSADMSRLGTQPRGEKNGAAKLSETQVHQIRKMRAAKISGYEIAEQFGVTAALVYAIEHRKTWAHI